MEDKIEVYVEDEEHPTDIKRRLKVLEFSVFTEEDKRRIVSALEKLDKLIEMSSKSRGDPELLASIDNLIFTLKRNEERFASLRNIPELQLGMDEFLAELRNKDEKIVALLSRVVDNMEATGRSLSEMKSELGRDFNLRMDSALTGVEERLYSIENTLNYTKSLLAEVAESRPADTSAELDRKIAVLAENLNEKVNAYISAVNAGLDNLGMQVTDPLVNVSTRLENMSSQMTEPLINIASRMDTIRSDISRLGKDVDALKKRKIKIPLPPTNALEMLMEAKKRIRSKRVNKKQKADKQRLINRIAGLEDGVLDIFIFSALGKQRLSIHQIKKDVPASETKIRKRLKALTTRKKITQGRKSKKDRTIVYSAV